MLTPPDGFTAAPLAERRPTPPLDEVRRLLARYRRFNPAPSRAVGGDLAATGDRRGGPARPAVRD